MNTLVKCYDMDSKLESMAVEEDFVAGVDLTLFHSDDYVDCLRNLQVAKKEQFID